jgi:hypothetical protein
LVARSGFHQNVATWAAIGGLALAVAGMIFSAGDARQTIVGHGVALEKTDVRVTTLERDVSDIKSTLARIDQASEDTRDTVHRLERGHVHQRADD